MAFISFYILKYHHGEQIRLKYYAGMVVINFYAELKDKMETKTSPLCRGVHTGPPSQHARVEANMVRPGMSACHNLYKIYQVLL